MDDIEAKRASMVWASANANQRRQQMLRVNRAYRQDQFAQREAARQAASRAAAEQRPRSSPPVVRQKQPPLVDSLDVAPWAVLRSLYPGW